MGVSRSPIREALHRLKQEGLVKELPTGGAYVALLDANDIRELYEVRAALERRIAALAAMKITHEDIQHLENLVLEMENAIAEGNSGQERTVDRIDRAFHEHFAKIAGNKRLLDMYAGLRDQIGVMIGLSWRRQRQVPPVERVVDDHRALIAALACGDSEVAGRAFERHVEEAGVRAVEEMERQQMEMIAGLPPRRRRRTRMATGPVGRG
jgi:DNA-binding GntR family transcriptional regulator